jgi:hypothetical protein
MRLIPSALKCAGGTGQATTIGLARIRQERNAEEHTPGLRADRAALGSMDEANYCRYIEIEKVQI